MADLIGQSLGSYRIESRLGAGGMGDVYRAVHTRLNRAAAIKVLHANQAADPTFQARFLREARAAAALSHPNIVEVFDFGEQDGASYLVMELVPDGSLRTLLRQRPQGQGWTLGLGIDLVRQAAEGLGYAHEHGMVHRDIKPDNLLLQRLTPVRAGEEDGVAGQYLLKISDFGLARLVDDASELTATGMVMGTPTYMSPEQCQGADLDGRSDLYSLGVVLYEVATGSPPFRVKSLSEAVFKHISAVPPRPREIQPDLPPALEDVIMRCLEKDPRNRVASGAELAKSLDGILGPADMQTVVTPHYASGGRTPTPSASGGDMAPTVVDSRADKIASTPPARLAAAPSSPADPHDDATIRATVSAGPSAPSRKPEAPAWVSSGAPAGTPPQDSRIRTLMSQPRTLAIAGVALVAVLVVVLLVGLRPLFASKGTTVTHQPTPTLAPSPTPADKVVFQDTMSKPSSQWGQSGRSYFSNGGFEINGAWLVFSPANALSNGTVSVRLRQIGGVSDQFYGLVIRAQNNESYYVFGLSESQQWSFQRVAHGGHTMIVAPTTDAHIKRGPNASNTITVVMRGSHFTFYVNGVQIGQADDSAYASGTTGIVNIVSRLQVVYNDFSVAVLA
ncbi:MAG TPA: protein kinase [Ktedonobacterales bacterium]|nr:protein kinase [Ktedonobacterales bacterium]